MDGDRKVDWKIWVVSAKAWATNWGAWGLPATLGGLALAAGVGINLGGGKAALTDMEGLPGAVVLMRVLFRLTLGPDYWKERKRRAELEALAARSRAEPVDRIAVPLPAKAEEEPPLSTEEAEKVAARFRAESEAVVDRWSRAEAEEKIAAGSGLIPN